MSSDPNPQGGDLSDMAVEGTKIPTNAGTQSTIPSVPRPDQITDPTNDPNNLGASDLAGAADNAQDISRVCRICTITPQVYPLTSHPTNNQRPRPYIRYCDGNWGRPALTSRFKAPPRCDRCGYQQGTWEV